MKIEFKFMLMFGLAIAYDHVTKQFGILLPFVLITCFDNHRFKELKDDNAPNL